MAVLKLTKVWVNRLDSGEAISAQSARGRSASYERPGEVRTLAAGRLRAVTAPGEGVVFTFTLLLVSLATVTKLRSWIGVPVLVRDHRGQAFTAVFFEVRPIELADPAKYHVALSMQGITVPEGI